VLGRELAHLRRSLGNLEVPQWRAEVRYRLCFIVLLGLSLVACGRSEHAGVFDGDSLVPPIPMWIEHHTQCVAPDEHENAQAELALRTFELFPNGGSLPIAATKYFGSRRFRSIGVEVCPPTDLYPRLVELTVQQGHFSGAHLFEDDLRLARQLGPADPRIVEAVARTAFNAQAIVGYEELHRDIRPLARTILAEYGDASRRFSDRAFAEMSGDTELGTSAAQLAVATRRPDAMLKVEQIMTRILRTNRDPIPRRVADRLEELGYALAFGGRDAEPHVGPVLAALDRRREGWAPPFGMVASAPVQLCFVLKRVGGAAARNRLRLPPCNSQYVTGAN
jgi:hypothetical protein